MYVDRPLEAYPNGKYDITQDILNDDVFAQLWYSITGDSYWHFGMPCASFSILNALSSGTRTRDLPQGDGSRDSEVHGNRILARMILLIKRIQQVGGQWSIENPLSSFLWRMPEVKALSRKELVYEVRFDQCMYGLSFKDSPTCRCKKATLLLTNHENLCSLAKKCDGSHKHVHAIGSVRLNGVWTKRSKVAGHYPLQLVRAWSRAAHAGCQ